MRFQPVFLAAMAMAFPAFGASGGSTSAEFLKFGVGARELGMGGAAVAASHGANALYWNPANLGFLKYSHISMMRADTLASGNYNYGAFAHPLRSWGTWAVSVQAGSPGDIQSTDETGVGLGTINPQDTSMALGWGKKFGQSLGLGFNGQWIRSKIVHTASAASLDLGAAYQWKDFGFGLSARHLLASQLKYVDEKNPLPRALQLGMAYRPGKRWIFSLDANQTRGYNLVMALGGEYMAPIGQNQKLFFRSGYQTRPRDLPGTQGVSLGFGWQLLNYELDYAFLPLGQLDGAQTHRISLGIRFHPGSGAPRSAPAAAAPAAPAAPAVFVDDDHDSVPNMRDECPGTKVGVPVNDAGCPNDMDEDGVLNAKDKCPSTPWRTAVNAEGCPDADGDGVADEKDECPGTASGLSVDSKGCVAIKAGEKASVNLDIKFDSGKTEVAPAYDDMLAKFAEFMKSDAALNVEIEGHTDNTGNAKANQSISQKRAENVLRRLESLGVPASRLKAVGYGPYKPEADNHTPEGRLRNRRVVATFTQSNPPK